MNSAGTDTPAAIRVLVVEDSVLLREGLVRLLEEAGCTTVGALGDATDLLEQIRATNPDVVLLDVRLPPSYRDEGIRAALAVRRAAPGIGVLVLSQYVETVYARELLADAAGGVGYLLKDRLTSLEELSEAVQRVHSGGTVLDQEVVRRLLVTSVDPLATLTPARARSARVDRPGTHQREHRRAPVHRRRRRREARQQPVHQARPA